MQKLGTRIGGKGMLYRKGRLRLGTMGSKIFRVIHMEDRHSDSASLASRSKKAKKAKKAYLSEKN